MNDGGVFNSILFLNVTLQHKHAGFSRLAVGSSHMLIGWTRCLRPAGGRGVAGRLFHLALLKITPPCLLFWALSILLPFSASARHR